MCNVSRKWPRWRQSHSHTCYSALIKRAGGWLVSPSTGTLGSRDGSLYTIRGKELGCWVDPINVHQVACGHCMGTMRVSDIVDLEVTEWNRSKKRVKLAVNSEHFFLQLRAVPRCEHLLVFSERVQSLFLGDRSEIVPWVCIWTLSLAG